MSDDLSKEEMRAQYEKSGTRTEQAAEEQSTQSLAEEVGEYLDAVREGDLNRNLSVRYDPVAAIWYTLQNNPEEQRRVRENLYDLLPEEPSEEDLENQERSELLRLLLRVGIREGAEEYAEAVEEAEMERLSTI